MFKIINHIPVCRAAPGLLIIFILVLPIVLKAQIKLRIYSVQGGLGTLMDVFNCQVLVHSNFNKLSDPTFSKYKCEMMCLAHSVYIVQAFN